MGDTKFRLIIEKLERGADISKISTFLKKRGLSENKIKDALKMPPRVLFDALTRNEAKKMQLALNKAGCNTYFEPIVSGMPYPFSISHKHYGIIKKELSKSLRAKANMVLLLIQVEASESRLKLPSMLGNFSEKLSDCLRESDTVIGIDDSRVIILCFSTEKGNVGHLKEKINGALIGLLGEGVRFTIGDSLFPDEGRNLPTLIDAADLKKQKQEHPKATEGQSPETPYVLARDKGTLSPIQVCFTEARGKIFRRLLDMDPQILLLGLSQLPQEKQREFLARLPFDSPLAPVLEEAIESQSKPAPDKIAQEDLETIIYYMELEEGLEERKKNQDELLSKLNRTESLPTLPSVASHVLLIASNPDSSASDLTEVIMNDPSLTSELLKIVNSAYYGFPQKIGTVKRAVVLLGTGEIVALAFGLSTARLFDAAHFKGIYSPKALWRHSMCAGLIAEHLCKRLPEYRKLGVFTAGLLHDFGKIILIENFPELYGQVHVEAKNHNLPLFDLEEEKFGLNHAMIGEFLASNWNLPEAIVQAIAFHHQPLSASSHSQLAAIIGLADYLYHEAATSGELPDTFMGSPCELSSCHWTFLGQLFPGFDTELLKKMTEDALGIINHSEELFMLLT